MIYSHTYQNKTNCRERPSIYLETDEGYFLYTVILKCAVPKRPERLSPKRLSMSYVWPLNIVVCNI